MTVIIDAAHSVEEYPTTNARILHAGLTPELLDPPATATTTAAGTSVDAAALNWSTYDYWQPTALPATFEIRIAATTFINCVAIAAHTLGSSGCSIHTTVTSGAILPSATVEVEDDSPILLLRAWRNTSRVQLQISGGSVMPRIGVIRTGAVLEMPQQLYQGVTPTPMQRATTYRQMRSETGEVLGRTRQRTVRPAAYEWSHLTEDWMREHWPPLQFAAETAPMWVAWRPTNGDCVFGDVSETPAAQISGPKSYMTAGLTLTGHSHD